MENINEFNTIPTFLSKYKKLNNIKLKYVTNDDEVLISRIDLCTILNIQASWPYKLSDPYAFTYFIYAEDKLRRKRRHHSKLLTILGVTEICNKGKASEDIIKWINTEIYGYEAIKLSPDTDTINDTNTSKDLSIDTNVNNNLNVQLFHLYRDAFYQLSNSDNLEKTAAFKLVTAFEPHLDKLIASLIEKL